MRFLSRRRKEKIAAPGEKLSSRLEDNLARLNQRLGSMADVVKREFYIAGDKPVKAFLFYIDGLVNRGLIDEIILKPLMEESLKRGRQFRSADEIYYHILSSTDAELVTTWAELLHRFLSGELCLLIDGNATAIVVDARGEQVRGIEEPPTEPVIRGPRDGFTENIRINTMMIRRRVKSEHLKMESFILGELTRTEVIVAYLANVAQPDVVAEVKKRLQEIKIDGVLESGYIEEFFCERPFCPFPTVLSTERPDRVAAALLEGRVALLVDGTPFALVMPVTFFSLLQASEDYYNNACYASALRLIRLLALNFSILLPSLYIAITTFHQEMIPTSLVVSLISSREGVPFPAFVEALLMEITFEVLREGGVRLPRPVGHAVSIVGALVIGQAAVAAGLVSTAMIIVVALTAIANFVIPSFEAATVVRLLRFPLMALSASLGLYGVGLGLLTILIYAASLRSFGVPYLSPMAPAVAGELSDVMVRRPWYLMFFRPKLIAGKDVQRLEKGSSELDRG